MERSSRRKLGLVSDDQPQFLAAAAAVTGWLCVTAVCAAGQQQAGSAVQHGQSAVGATAAQLRTAGLGGRHTDIGQHVETRRAEVHPAAGLGEGRAARRQRQRRLRGQVSGLCGRIAG